MIHVIIFVLPENADVHDCTVVSLLSLLGFCVGYHHIH